MHRTAMIEVRVLPWRPRARVMDADEFRDVVGNGNPFELVDDLGGVVVSLAVWVALIVAAPLVVVVLAALLLSVELPVVLAVAGGRVPLRWSWT